MTKTLQEKYDDLDGKFRSLLSEYQDMHRKLYEYQRSNERTQEMLDVLLDHLNLDVKYETRWWITKKRRYFK